MATAIREMRIGFLFGRHFPVRPAYIPRHKTVIFGWENVWPKEVLRGVQKMSFPAVSLSRDGVRADSVPAFGVCDRGGFDLKKPGYADPAEAGHSQDAESRYGFGILSLQSATEPGAIAEALHWIEAAAKQGHAGAEQLLRKIAQAA